ncbi:6698_t:CDS:2 [Paraglomus occultum]|uniref:6698_t:CDS:1 n=1 Tax=Paraglomus occultum TaxID=144539 RepID=A0A9N9BWY3_9GLOM|nr:6698_t:CDS:2 [Paraglomus occultum]
MPDPELDTLVNCVRAIAAFAVIGAGLTLFYMIRSRDIVLSIFKLLINGIALTFAISSIKDLNDPGKPNIHEDYNPQTHSALIYVTLTTTESISFVVFALMPTMPTQTLIDESDISARASVIVGVIVVIFAAIRLIHHRCVTTFDPPNALLFTLNLFRVLLIPVHVNSDTVDADVLPVNSVEHVPSVNAMAHVPSINNVGMGHVPAGGHCKHTVDKFF